MKFFPLITDGCDIHKSSLDPHIQKTARDPDYLLPFRSSAPIFQNALDTILSDHNRLSTAVGIFNLAAFRGVFYRSEYVLNNLQWFNSITDWEEYRESLGMTDDKLEAFFVNKSAYGRPQPKLLSTFVYQHWDQCQQTWAAHQQSNPTYDIIKLFNYFMKTFHYVGSLTALLMVGDLIECGFLPLPTPEKMGELVALVDKGAAKGLQRLGLLKSDSTPEEISRAFVTLHLHIENSIDTDIRSRMGYNIIMLEHALCKYQRIYRAGRKGIKWRKK